jgi:hypothetical protein
MLMELYGNARDRTVTISSNGTESGRWASEMLQLKRGLRVAGAGGRNRTGTSLLDPRDFKSKPRPGTIGLHRTPSVEIHILTSPATAHPLPVSDDSFQWNTESRRKAEQVLGSRILLPKVQISAKSARDVESLALLEVIEIQCHSLQLSVCFA